MSMRAAGAWQGRLSAVRVHDQAVLRPLVCTWAVLVPAVAGRERVHLWLGAQRRQPLAGQPGGVDEQLSLVCVVAEARCCTAEQAPVVAAVHAAWQAHIQAWHGHPWALQPVHPQRLSTCMLDNCMHDCAMQVKSRPLPPLKLSALCRRSIAPPMPCTGPAALKPEPNILDVLACFSRVHAGGTAGSMKLKMHMLSTSRLPQSQL